MFSNIMAVIFLGLVVYLIVSEKSEVDSKTIKESRKEAKAKKEMWM
ncbi:hypothetical protein [Pontibacillus marinus]|uniref:Uncharacterized protein n=1 Tax=Pontibacillus marinus BH030004 = DSM 16465 TaxID=1385511 RepID=A0A0A5FZL1_9BACI|nr:hypothetical protein [Pontibacillus marinus]KGX84260.1 hypothetical protein N783_17980 [Pontibacillus marinus BH030004 = DSM 16465]